MDSVLLKQRCPFKLSLRLTVCSNACLNVSHQLCCSGYTGQANDIKLSCRISSVQSSLLACHMLNSDAIGV